MHISRSDRETAVFVLKWADLEKLLALISGLLPIVTISASCADKLSREFADVKELRGFGNPERAAITELRLVARDQDRMQRFSLSLSNDPRHNARITIDGDEATATRINDIYQDFLDSTRPWYSWVAKADWYFVVSGIFLLIVFSNIAITLIKATKITFEWPKDGSPAKYFLGGFLVSFIPLFIGIAMNRLKSRFFPTGTFAFGDGENRHIRSEVIRTVLIASFAVSIVSSLVVAWFQ